MGLDIAHPAHANCSKPTVTAVSMPRFDALSPSTPDEPSTSGSRRTQAARVAISLRELGRPATKEELAALCDLSVTRVGSLLSKLEGVLRADKNRWGLAEWIDDEYEGIPAEIMQRITEDGGSTRVTRILDELPRLFGVSEGSVRSSLASPAFRVENGWVIAVKNPVLGLGTLADVATGRDDSGYLYWIFTMYERHLRGFSVTGVPPELAVSLGCEFGQKSYIGVHTPRGVSAISVIWRKTSPTGPEIGRIAQSLKAIHAIDGDSIALVIRPDRTVSIAHRREVSKAAHEKHNRNASSSHGVDDGSDDLEAGVRAMAPIIGRVDIRLDTLDSALNSQGSGNED